MIPIQVKRCPFVPERFRRAKCWKRCVQWDRKRHECRLEMRQRIDETINGRKNE